VNLGLEDKTVVVTGGSSGIGLETARSFAAEGARVLICARRAEVLETAREDIEQSTGEAVETVQVDVTEVSDIDELRDEVTRRFGRLDVLVNNAGTGTYKPFLEITDEELEYGMAINFFAQFRVTQRFAPIMIDQGGGSIVNVSGATGMSVQDAPFLSSATGPAKAAEIRFSRILANELGPHNIRVNVVVPGLVLTPERFAKWEREMLASDAAEPEKVREEWGNRIALPDKEWGTAQELADLIVFAASDRVRFMTGAVLVADGGQDKS
jgi:NAD(P)-dependent dehydrogenase (short-subunit alcohol dehydrogenase family)